jgi:methylmalonyl-CoA mutase, N-terminal domain
VEAIEQGFMQDEIAASAYKYQKDIEKGDKISVGVNKFVSEETSKTPVFKIDESIQKIQTEKIELLKSKRNNDTALKCLQAISNAAKGSENLMPLVVTAVENYCTLGEIADELRNVFGEYK